jgi:hypothetical protein
MGSAARRHGAYGGEYMRAGLRLRARLKKIGKILVKLGLEDTSKRGIAAAADQISSVLGISLL